MPISTAIAAPAVTSQEEEEGQAARRTRNLRVALDPKTVELKSDAATAVQLESLKRTERIWLRGKWLRGERQHQQQPGIDEEVSAARARWEAEAGANGVASPLVVCDRATDHAVLRYSHADAACPDFRKDKPMLLIEGGASYGRTGNNLIEFLHAVQISRDQGIQLGATSQSWAMELITNLWFETRGGNTPEAHAEIDMFERTFCIKVFHTEQELEGWVFKTIGREKEKNTFKETARMFRYRSPLPLAEYMSSQLDLFRRLFSNYNTGHGVNSLGHPTQNMCAGLEALFPAEERASAIYTAIHSRHLEGRAGLNMLGLEAKNTGCDPTAALEMRPEYIKGILAPLGMLQYPIVFISDGEDLTVLERLLADPEIGPQIRVLDQNATSLGGDITMAIMSNVFIGNPASTFSGFIGKARLAFGKGHNELWWAVDPSTGHWRRVCGDNCLFAHGLDVAVPA